MSISARRIVTRVVNNVDMATHVGREGEIFYDPTSETPELRFSNGVSPGGVSGNIATPTDAIAYAIALG